MERHARGKGFYVSDKEKTVLTHCPQLEAVENSLLDGKTAKVNDVKHKRMLSLHEAFEKGLIVSVDRYATPFESISLWEAIDREQLDTETGMFYSVHEEKKTMTLEEAIYRKYIEKKSAFVKDTWCQRYKTFF